MTWTYGADPGADENDEVRVMVGDTLSTDPLVQDEEIEYALTMYPKPSDGIPPYYAAAFVCENIAALFARRAQRSIGSLSISAQQQYEHYVAKAQSLRVLAKTNGRGGGAGLGVPVLGGGGSTVLGSLYPSQGA